jgi:hypothetical protein
MGSSQFQRECFCVLATLSSAVSGGFTGDAQPLALNRSDTAKADSAHRMIGIDVCKGIVGVVSGDFGAVPDRNPRERVHSREGGGAPAAARFPTSPQDTAAAGARMIRRPIEATPTAG